MPFSNIVLIVPPRVSSKVSDTVGITSPAIEDCLSEVTINGSWSTSVDEISIL